MYAYVRGTLCDNVRDRRARWVCAVRYLWTLFCIQVMKRHEFLVKIMRDRGICRDFYVFRFLGRHYVGNPSDNIRLRESTFEMLFPFLTPVPAFKLSHTRSGMLCWVLTEHAKEIEK